MTASFLRRILSAASDLLILAAMYSLPVRLPFEVRS